MLCTKYKPSMRLHRSLQWRWRPQGLDAGCGESGGSGGIGGGEPLQREESEVEISCDAFWRGFPTVASDAIDMQKMSSSTTLPQCSCACLSRFPPPQLPAVYYSAFCAVLTRMRRSSRVRCMALELELFTTSVLAHFSYCSGPVSPLTLCPIRTSGTSDRIFSRWREAFLTRTIHRREPLQSIVVFLQRSKSLPKCTPTLIHRLVMYPPIVQQVPTNRRQIHVSI